MAARNGTFITVLGLALFSFMAGPAQAGCGCEKPPPPYTTVRPAATYAGTPVSLIHEDLAPGSAYTVTFSSGAAEPVTVEAVAALRRDLADGQNRPHLVVDLPDLPLGPTAIAVHAAGQAEALLLIEDADFTIVPQPIVVPAWTDDVDFKDFQAAVSRDGTAYISLDMSNVTQAMVLEARAKGYPLRFSGGGVLFYNVQGVLMQQLDQGIPGLYTRFAPEKDEDSDVLRYSRHEFSSFYLQHEERQRHAVDADDPNWHLDGTPHVDHNHLVLAISGYVQGSGSTGIKEDPHADALPAPGATRPFKLEIRTSPLVDHAVAAERAITMSGSARVKGDVVTNGTLALSDKARVDDDATVFATAITGKAKVGKTIIATEPTEFLPVYLPSAIDRLGSVVIAAGESRTLVGPASFLATELRIEEGGELFIDNSAGPVIVYVTGSVVADRGRIRPYWRAADEFALYVDGGGDVRLPGTGILYGIVYAPSSRVSMNGSGRVVGAIVAGEVVLTDNAGVDYDKDLGRGKKHKRFEN
jgi:cytoskeletal protein CcmA (bactofilin family)